MTQIEQIKAEIERLKSQLVRGACAAGIAMETNCKEEAYNEVLAFIDSLPAETASPELEKQNTKEDFCYQCKWYVKNIRFGDDCPYWKNMINPIKCEHFKQKNAAI